MGQKQNKVRMARGLRFGYEKIPAELVMIPEAILSSRGKRLCGHIGSYGVKGCFESKATLGRYFGVSRWTMIRLVKQLKMLRLIVWVNTNGVPGCMWLRVNPKVQAAEVLIYRGRSIKNPAFTCSKSATGPVAPAPQGPVALAPHNYDKTNKNTTAASPSPDEVRAQRLKEAEELRRQVLDSELRTRIVGRLPASNFADPEQVQRRHELILAMINRGEELVAAGMSIDEAVEEMFNETRFAVAVQEIS